MAGNLDLIRQKAFNPVNLKEYLKAKFSCLDIAARDSEGKRYNIEMQVRGSDSYIARAIYYHDKLYASQLIEGDEYGILKKTLSISILNFVLLEEEKELHNVCRYVILQSGRELMEARQKALHDEATWRAEAQREDRRVGRLEGKLEEKRETARAMKTEGIDRAP